MRIAARAQRYTRSTQLNKKKYLLPFVSIHNQGMRVQCLNAVNKWSSDATHRGDCRNARRTTTCRLADPGCGRSPSRSFCCWRIFLSIGCHCPSGLQQCRTSQAPTSYLLRPRPCIGSRCPLRGLMQAVRRRRAMPYKSKKVLPSCTLLGRDCRFGI